MGESDGKQRDQKEKESHSDIPFDFTHSFHLSIFHLSIFITGFFVLLSPLELKRLLEFMKELFSNFPLSSNLEECFFGKYNPTVSPACNLQCGSQCRVKGTLNTLYRHFEKEGLHICACVVYLTERQKLINLTKL